MSSVANTAEYESWNGDSGRRWAVSADHRDRVLSPVSDALFAAARPQPGEIVIDVGCGCGATSLRAATAVGPSGYVLGSDLSEPMLDVARRRAQVAGATNATFIQADVQTHAFDDGLADLAISRFGTMFFSDPVAAFANLARGLRPAARVCLATWQPLVANDWLTIPGAALLEYATFPDGDPNAPGMFAQSDPDRVTATLNAAGYTDVSLDPVAVTLTLGADVEAATQHLAESGPGRVVLECIPAGERAGALDAVRTVLGDHAGGSGVQLGAAIWIVTAQRAHRAQRV